MGSTARPAAAPSAPRPAAVGANAVILDGVVSSPPRPVELSSGSTLLRVEVTTQLDDGTAASVPVVWFDPTWRPDAADAIVVVGTVRRRFFRSGGVTRSSTEVVARSVVPARRRRTADRTVRREVRRVLEGRGLDG